MEIIEDALKRGATSLSEYDSKRVLAAQGIFITPEKIVATIDEAISAASKIGYPVVLKGSGETLNHKSELGLIAVDLRNETDVKQAFAKLTSNPEILVEEVLVQKMVPGDREFVVGMSRDPLFGPCVMFGLGGIFTEALQDVTFRIAPLSRADAIDMMEEIRGKKLLGATRGKPPVNPEELVDILIAVGNLGLDCDQIKEIDINPLKILGDKPVAVDALVVLNEYS